MAPDIRMFALGTLCQVGTTTQTANYHDATESAATCVYSDSHSTSLDPTLMNLMLRYFAGRAPILNLLTARSWFATSVVALALFAGVVACTTATQEESTASTVEAPTVIPTPIPATATPEPSPTPVEESSSNGDTDAPGPTPTLQAAPTSTPEPAEPLVPAIPTTPLPDAVPEDIAIIWEAFQVIFDEYYDHSVVDPAAMSEEAIKAIVETLDDPHTRYVSPQAFELSRDDLAGAFFGIGATVSADPDGAGVIITKPHRGSPAEKAGILVGDRIVAVDGVDATTWSVTEAVLKIRGERGKPVVLTILHAGETDPVEVTIIRDRVELESVTSRLIPETPYGELNIEQFTEETPSEIREHLAELLDQGVKAVVVDLRNNPGGLLGATLDSTSEFIAEGMLAYEVDRNGTRRDFHAHGQANFPNLPITVLVNNWSGSGAELFAGALQDHGRAVLIGTTTFGKGSVNITRRLSNGGGINVTIRRWFTPNGNVIEGVGLTPDVVVEYPENVSERDVEFTDPQLEAAIRQLDFQTRITTSATP